MNGANIDRRLVLKGLMATTAGVLLAPPAARCDEPGDWARVRAAFTPSQHILNLNNAGVSPQPKIVQEAMVRAYRFANELPDVNMWEVLDGDRERIKEKLSVIAGCMPREIAFNRNSTEGLSTAIFGIDLAPGDEVIVSDWDYPAMRHAWALRAKRHGIVIKPVSFDPMAEDDEIVSQYRMAVTPRTKVMHLTHMVHYTGRVLPVERLCAVAKDAGDIQTIVDAAQSFAQLPLSFERIGCDYLAVSLHKWLCAPFGTGMLIVRQSRFDALWPLLGPFTGDPHGVDKIDGENLGTYSSPAEHAIGTAVDFHTAIGTERVHDRLRYLSRYWIERASDVRGFTLHTPMSHPETAAITLFSINGLDAGTIEKRLRREHNIHVLTRNIHGLSGIRVSPHVYTNEADLERFAAALHHVARTERAKSSRASGDV